MLFTVPNIGSEESVTDDYCAYHYLRENGQLWDTSTLVYP